MKPLTGMGVSIHAPVRGATHQSISGAAATYRFNPRARAGRDILTPTIRFKNIFSLISAHPIKIIPHHIQLSKSLLA
jgi:hypothetical protein